MNWNGLRTLFTEKVHPAVRDSVLARISSGGGPICHGKWFRGRVPCLFSAASMAAGNALLSNTGPGMNEAAARLGITSDQVGGGVRLWDSATDEERTHFRETITAYLANRAVQQMEQAAVAGAEQAPTPTSAPVDRQPAMAG